MSMLPRLGHLGHLGRPPASGAWADDRPFFLVYPDVDQRRVLQRWHLGAAWLHNAWMAASYTPGGAGDWLAIWRDGPYRDLPFGLVELLARRFERRQTDAACADQSLRWRKRDPIAKIEVPVQNIEIRLGRFRLPPLGWVAVPGLPAPPRPVRMLVIRRSRRGFAIAFGAELPS